MPTLATIDRRLTRLEARAPTQRSAPRQDSLPPLSPEATRAVLKMLVEMGALAPPLEGVPDQWQKLRGALSRRDPLDNDGGSLATE